MRKVKLASATMAIVLALLVLPAALVTGQPPAGAPKDEILGWYVFVHGGIHAGALEDARVKKVGDRSFIVGRVVNDPALPNRLAGTLLYLPIDKVESLSVYDNLEDLKRVWGKR